MGNVRYTNLEESFLESFPDPDSDTCLSSICSDCTEKYSKMNTLFLLGLAVEQELDDNERKALKLRCEDNFTYIEIGEKLSISNKAAQRLVLRAKKKIFSKLEYVYYYNDCGEILRERRNMNLKESREALRNLSEEYEAAAENTEKMIERRRRKLRAFPDADEARTLNYELKILYQERSELRDTASRLKNYYRLSSD